MEKSASILQEFTLLISGTIIFVLLFVIILNVLKQISIFRGTTAVVVAICVSLLSVIGLSQFFLITEVSCETEENRHRFNFDLDFILLPYVALALSVLLMLLFRFVRTRSRNNKTDSSQKEISRRMR